MLFGAVFAKPQSTFLHAVSTSLRC